MEKTYIKYEKKGNTIYGKGSYKDLLKDIEAFRDKKYKCKNSDNSRKMDRFTTNNDSNHIRFSGGKWEDVTNMKNFNMFKKQLEEFKKNKLEEKIKSKIDYSPKRVRRLSEHDGDYDHDKQWEIKPFTHSKKELLPISTIDVKVDMSISAVMSAEAINDYGALVWSVIQLVESLGIQVNIDITNTGTNFLHSSSRVENDLTYRIKKSGEYISPVALATVFQSVFYRRAMFCGITMSADVFNERVCDGLGTPKVLRTDKHIWFEKGVLHTRPGGLFKIKEVESAILSMVTKGK